MTTNKSQETKYNNKKPISKDEIDFKFLKHDQSDFKKSLIRATIKKDFLLEKKNAEIKPEIRKDSKRLKIKLENLKQKKRILLNKFKKKTDRHNYIKSIRKLSWIKINNDFRHEKIENNMLSENQSDSDSGSNMKVDVENLNFNLKIKENPYCTLDEVES